jgi:hypothetical protein
MYGAYIPYGCYLPQIGIDPRRVRFDVRGRFEPDGMGGAHMRVAPVYPGELN